MRYGRFPTRTGGRMAYADAFAHVELRERYRVVV
jgi:hypothetical protein